ncbi:MAG TPA: hypothetical protein VL137_16665 [Polyangiaceae bacterium]|nr:hypothetical protein [Polyangiaceae bacterium]
MRSWSVPCLGLALGLHSVLAAAQSSVSAPAPQGEGTVAAQGAAPVSAAPSEPQGMSSTGVEVGAAPSTASPNGPRDDTRMGAMQAYQVALQRQRLDAAAGGLSAARLREELQRAEQMVQDGRSDEAIGDLVYWISNPSFAPLAELPEGRGMRFLLGDALARAGVIELARGHLLPLLNGKQDLWFRRAVRTEIDLALRSPSAAVLLADLQPIEAHAPVELRSDIEYLHGRALETAGQAQAALSAYHAVTPRGRFWAQAQYRAGLLQVDAGQYKQAENLFCLVADPKQTPKEAPLFGGSDFFQVRDLARLGLGRVAHEQYRFDDARYYYYLIPQDSDHLPEALYESATSRYEAKDYTAARDLLQELRAVGGGHVYQDEAWVLEAYVDMALCEFPKADAKLKLFVKRYEPVRSAIRQLLGDSNALQHLVEALRLNQDPALAGLGVEDDVARTVGVLLRVDASYRAASQQMADLDHQLHGLSQSMAELDALQSNLAAPGALQPRANDTDTRNATQKVDLINDQLSDVQRSLRQLQRSGKTAQLAGLRSEFVRLQEQAATLQAAQHASVATPAPGATVGLPALLAADRTSASELYVATGELKQTLIAREQSLAKEAFERLERRLSRLLRRAHLARVETVLGKKHALELEIDALAQGFLPRDAVDSLDAARYLMDDEEYWPFDGEDWADEYVGGEGLH